MGSRKCKNPDCGKRFSVPRETPPWVRWCSKPCKIEVGVQEARKARERRERAQKAALNRKKKKRGQEKREYQRQNIRTRKRAAKEACHAYVRERDAGRDCVSCRKPWDGEFDAGHFLESGNNPFLRYDESNTAGQCRKCNRFKGGATADFERNLRQRIGDGEVDRLLSMRGGTLKRTPDDYYEIEQYYKAKLKELKNG